MSTDNNNNGSESKQPLRLSKPGKLELRKTVDAGQVKQSFSHGRSKTVVVEKRTKRTFERGATGKMAAVPNQELAEGLASLKKSGPSSDQDRANAARRAACSSAVSLAGSPHISGGKVSGASVMPPPWPPAPPRHPETREPADCRAG